MFEAVELGQTLDKAEFKQQEHELRGTLLELQRELAEAKVPVIIIVAGLGGAGKGNVVDRFNKWLDSRGLQTHAFWDETDEELERPDHWRFWKRLPARGTISVMFNGWYGNALGQHIRGELSKTELDEETLRINQLERMLTRDGTLIIKLWFHLSFEAHSRRIKKRQKSKHRVPGLEGHLYTREEYDQMLATAERLLRKTESGACPWQMIESDDKWFRDMAAGKSLQAVMQMSLRELKSSGNITCKELEAPPLSLDFPVRTVLDKVDLDVALEREDYKKKLCHYQKKLHDLSWKAYLSHRSIVLVFEGWDAAGKGGAIRRLLSAMDARLYRVISVAAPTDEELNHHYLWRFWRQVPRAGYMTLYDRSWYGRVLVERVEGFAQSSEWMWAYKEINNFEEQLTEHGTMVLKFWLHISPEEQLRRFHDREKTPWKQHKITEEDWRNREKWDDYKSAVNDMIAHTSTQNAPWVLIPANDKLFARVEILKTVCQRLKKSLEL
jgi:polyphosphate:AMP phosphotransferase